MDVFDPGRIRQVDDRIAGNDQIGQAADGPVFPWSVVPIDGAEGRGQVTTGGIADHRDAVGIDAKAVGMLAQVADGRTAIALQVKQRGSRVKCGKILPRLGNVAVTDGHGHRAPVREKPGMGCEDPAIPGGAVAALPARPSASVNGQDRRPARRQRGPIFG